MPPRIAVLASGRGSNLRVLLDYFAADHRRDAALVALVASDRADAGALDVARDHGVEARSLELGEQHEASLLQLFVEQSIDLVVLAGYVRLIPPAVVRGYEGRMINVHPALLPAFGGKGMYGGRVHRAVLESGVRLSGPTVHFVDELYDHGAIIAQWPVPVLRHDTEQTLAARVLFAEHRLLPRVVHALAIGRLRWHPDRGATGASLGVADAAAFLIGDPSELEHAMDRALAIDRAASASRAPHPPSLA